MMDRNERDHSVKAVLTDYKPGSDMPLQVYLVGASELRSVLPSLTSSKFKRGDARHVRRLSDAAVSVPNKVAHSFKPVFGAERPSSPGAKPSSGFVSLSKAGPLLLKFDKLSSIDDDLVLEVARGRLRSHARVRGCRSRRLGGARREQLTALGQRSQSTVGRTS